MQKMKELLRSSNPQKIAEVFFNGGIVIFPTDTVWGIGCIFDNTESIKRLYEIKHRQPDKPTSLLIPSFDWLQKLALPVESQNAAILEKNWPGALTAVIKAKPGIQGKLFVSEQNEIGLRIPNHQPLLKILKLINKPVLAPSANFATFPPPKTLKQLDPKLISLADAVFLSHDGLGVESTVIKLSQSGPVIIRAGAVKI